MLMLLKKRKKHERRLDAAIAAHKNLLIEYLRKEWGEMEKAERRELRRKELMEIAKTSGRVAAQTLLVLTALAGVVVIAAVAPNIFAAFGRFSGGRRYFNKNKFSKTVAYLKERNLIEVKKDSKEYNLTITESGLVQAARDGWNGLRIKRVPEWDGCWRVVIFDIPDRKKWERDAFRRRLRALGFYQLQKSVFAYPDPCEDEVSFLVSFLNISEYVRFITTKTISREDDLKALFGIERRD